MDIANSMDFIRYWNYYLSIESQLLATNQFVSHETENLNTYSNEFAKIILLAGAEVDVLFQELCKLEGHDNARNMKDYAAILGATEEDKYNVINDVEYAYEMPFLSIHPWQGYDITKPYAGITWWEHYQKIKHNRFYAYKYANLDTALKAVVAHYYLTQRLENYLKDSHPYSQEHLRSLCVSQRFIPCV